MRTIIIGAIVGLALPAWAGPLKVDVEDAADHQVAAQGTYRGGLKNSWEWRFGSKRSAMNITGAVAHGLLAAYALTGLKSHEDSAIKAAKSLVKAYDRGWKHRRPKTQDIEFLAAAGYIIDAARWFNVLAGRWSARSFVDYVISARRKRNGASLAGWDIASAIRAAVAVGKVRYARGLLDRLIQQRAAWDRADAAGAQILSRASILWAVNRLKRRSVLNATQRRFVRGVLAGVRAAQRADGSFPTRDRKEICTQTTAYAALGLAGWSSGRRASARAKAWLRRVARTDRRFFVGGRIWASRYDLRRRPRGAYHSQVQSEVLRALVGR